MKPSRRLLRFRYVRRIKPRGLLHLTANDNYLLVDNLMTQYADEWTDGFLAFCPTRPRARRRMGKSEFLKHDLLPGNADADYRSLSLEACCIKYANGVYGRHMIFVEAPGFERIRERYLDDDQYRYCSWRSWPIPNLET
jgi:hypothetical protein